MRTEREIRNMIEMIKKRSHDDNEIEDLVHMQQLRVLYWVLKERFEEEKTNE